MAHATGIQAVHQTDDGRLRVELSYSSDRPSGPSFGLETKVKFRFMDREKFLDWDQFQLALENAGIQPTAELGARLGAKESHLREDWEYWKEMIEAGKV